MAGLSAKKKDKPRRNYRRILDEFYSCKSRAELTEYWIFNLFLYNYSRYICICADAGNTFSFFLFCTENYKYGYSEFLLFINK